MLLVVFSMLLLCTAGLLSIRFLQARRNAETALRRSEKGYRDLVDNIPAVVYRCDCEAPFPLHYLNAQFVQISGFQAERFLHQGNSSLLEIIYPHDVDEVASRIEHHVAVATPFALEYRIVHADGTLRWVRNEGRAVYDEAGTAISIDGVLLDITEQKHAEAAVHLSEAKYRLLADHSTDMISVGSEDGFFSYVSPACREVLGYESEELTGTRLADLLHPGDPPSGSSPLQEPEGDNVTNRYRIRRKSGDYRWFESKSRYLPDTGTGKSDIISVWRDVTDQVNLQLQLEELNQSLEQIVEARTRSLMLSRDLLEKQSEKILEANRKLKEMNSQLMENQVQLVQSEKMASLGHLVSGIAHEINNPLSYVMSNLESLTASFRRLSQDLKNEANLQFLLSEMSEMLFDANEGAGRVSDIIQNLKIFARMDHGDRKPVDINEGIEATLKILTNEMKYKCDLEKHLSPLPPVCCNAGQLNQVFLNLLLNALHAIPEKGTIVVSSELAGDEVIVSISDTGNGIAEEDQPHIFTPFFTTKQVGKGPGLGLAVAYGIVRDHRGRIEVESEIGRGTTFTVHLPLEPEVIFSEKPVS